MRFLRNVLSSIWALLAIGLTLILWLDDWEVFKENVLIGLISILIIGLMGVSSFAMFDHVDYLDEKNVQRESRALAVIATFFATVFIFFGILIFTNHQEMWYTASEVNLLNDAHTQSYDEGYDKGYEDGKIDGYNDCLSAVRNHPENFITNNSNASQNNEILSTSEAPDSYVFVTPSGSKYHKDGCQYINGRYDLSYFENADEAEANGYSPCSVCNP